MDYGGYRQMMAHNRKHPEVNTHLVINPYSRKHWLSWRLRVLADYKLNYRYHLPKPWMRKRIRETAWNEALLYH